jgi:hypothetical protein
MVAATFSSGRMRDSIGAGAFAKGGVVFGLPAHENADPPQSCAISPEPFDLFFCHARVRAVKFDH